MEHWYQRLGKQFATFMCGGVASKLGDHPAFEAKMEYWYQRLGTQFATFMCNGVASKLGDHPAFEARMEHWYQRLGTQFATTMHRVGGKISKDDFNMQLIEWCTSLGTDKFMSF
jgi:hypothetical protein